jgi:hypothetical protein
MGQFILFPVFSSLCKTPVSFGLYNIFICFNSSNLDEATHCFVELSKASLPVDLSVLVKKRIPCVPPLYLNDYLIKNPPPQAHNCVVPEYKHLLQTL